MLVTTYQHDYVPPQSRRYDFLKRFHQHDSTHPKEEKEECQCVEEQKIEPPKAVLDKCGDIEWTGVAPLGRLIEPRIIPTKLPPEQVQKMSRVPDIDCFKDQPNRFLKILRTVYPDLYERLKQMPKDELNRRTDQQRLLTTYQIDYCNMNEFPEGVYESLKEEEKTSELNASKLLRHEGPCNEFRKNVMAQLGREVEAGGGDSRDPCADVYKPFKISFSDSARFIASGNASHWKTTIFTKKPDFSEYMESISKNGCIITENNIHDHSKCVGGKHCRHQLIHTCQEIGRKELVTKLMKKKLDLGGGPGCCSAERCK